MMTNMSPDKPIEGLIIHGPGNCPECGAPLYVVDCEMTFMELNPDGIPITEETSYKCKGVCSRCGTKFPNMMRWGGGYIPVSPASFIIRSNQLADEAMERWESLNLGAGNPLAIEAPASENTEEVRDNGNNRIQGTEGALR